MTMTLYTNPLTNDLAIQAGSFVRVTGADEVKQRILVTLRHYYGEYFLNLQGGVPWYELILGSKNKPLVEAILRQIILGVPGVLSILGFSLVVSNRRLSIGTTVEVQGSTTYFQQTSPPVIVPVVILVDENGVRLSDENSVLLGG